MDSVSIYSSVPPRGPEKQETTDVPTFSTYIPESVCCSAKQQAYTSPLKKRRVESTGAASDLLAAQADTKPLQLPEALLKECDSLARHYLLQPYDPLNPLGKGLIERPVHGVQHATRLSVWALVLLQLRRKQGDPAALAFPDSMISLLIQTCLLHDSGREADGVDQKQWEKASGENLAEHLRNSGECQSLAALCGQAIKYKDEPEKCRDLPENIKLIRSLLHDADVLEVMRTRDKFYMDRLEVLNDCPEPFRQDYVDLAVNVRKIIAGECDMKGRTAIYDKEGGTLLQSGIKPTYSMDKKKQWEHSQRPLTEQLLHITSTIPFLNTLIEPEQKLQADSFALQKLHRESGTLGSVDGLSGKYKDPDTGNRYYIKEAAPESAHNQVLMANIARHFGLTVPPVFVHEENGKTMVVSQWIDGLTGGREKLEGLSEEVWAKILIINSIVGNQDIVNSGWANIELDKQGTPVMFDWDWAGLTNRYPREWTKHRPCADDFSSMPLVFNTWRSPKAPPLLSTSGCVGINESCKALFKRLPNDKLEEALSGILSNTNWQELDKLIEGSGFKPGDRTWLRQTIYDRIAWLVTRFPRSNAERVSPPEHKAVESAGNRGFCFQTTPRDIRNGQVRVFQRLDRNGHAQTCLRADLTREASYRLADHLGLECSLHTLISQITFLNMNRHKVAQCKGFTSDVRVFSSECEQLINSLEHDKARWGRDTEAVGQIIKDLESIKSKTRAFLRQPESILEELPVPEDLPPAQAPARVSSILTEPSKVKIELADSYYGHSRLTGGTQDINTAKPIIAFQVPVSPVQRNVHPDGTMNHSQGMLRFFPENMPYAQSFENQVEITLPGHDKAVVEQLFSELEKLGINAQRPSVEELEEQWLDQLADYHGSLEAMNEQVEQDISDSATIEKKKHYIATHLEPDADNLDWELHCRVRSGELVRYRPGFPHNIEKSEAFKFSLGHDMNYNLQNHSETGEVISEIVNSGASLDSFKRRSNKGVYSRKEATIDTEIRDCSAPFVFTRMQSNHPDMSVDANQLAFSFKSKALGRLDAYVFDSNETMKSTVGNNPGYLRKMRKRPRSYNEYKNIVTGRDRGAQVDFTSSLSLWDELDSLKIGVPESREAVLQQVKRRRDYWPDGRPIEQVFTHSWRTYFKEITSSKSPVPLPIKKLVKLAGPQQLQHLLKNNPDLLNGKLDNMNGVVFKGGWLQEVDLTKYSLEGATFLNVTFDNCVFSLSQSGFDVKDSVFNDCFVEGDITSSYILTSNRFRFSSHKSQALEGFLKKTAEFYGVSPQCADAKENLPLWVDLIFRCLSSTNIKPLDVRFISDVLSNCQDQIKEMDEESIDRLIRKYVPGSYQSVLKHDHDLFQHFIKDNPRFMYGESDPNWYEKFVGKKKYHLLKERPDCHPNKLTEGYYDAISFGVENETIELEDSLFWLDKLALRWRSEGHHDNIKVREYYVDWVSQLLIKQIDDKKDGYAEAVIKSEALLPYDLLIHAFKALLDGDFKDKYIPQFYRSIVYAYKNISGLKAGDISYNVLQLKLFLEAEYPVISEQFNKKMQILDWFGK